MRTFVHTHKLGNSSNKLISRSVDFFQSPHAPFSQLTEGNLARYNDVHMRSFLWPYHSYTFSESTEDTRHRFSYNFSLDPFVIPWIGLSARSLFIRWPRQLVRIITTTLILRWQVYGGNMHMIGAALAGSFALSAFSEQMFGPIETNRNTRSTLYSCITKTNLFLLLLMA